MSNALVLTRVLRTDRKFISWPFQITEAIRYIHSKGVVHCDVGIHNFLVQDNGTLALADFGGSRVDGSKCQEAGLPRYKRPTLARDSDPTEIDDIFSLGMVIYEVKTGQMAYAGKSNGEIRNLLESLVQVGTERPVFVISKDAFVMRRTHEQSDIMRGVRKP